MPVSKKLGDIERERRRELGETDCEPFRDRTDPPPGLYNRYIVSKSDGTPVDPRAIYFVLRLDEYGDDKGHIEACRRAAHEWCASAPLHLSKVAEDLKALLWHIEQEENAK